MKKVVIAVNSYGGGGAERVATVWASRLSELGYAVSMLAFTRKEVEYKTSSKVVKRYVADNDAEFKKLSFVAKYKTFRNILKEELPECVISLLPAMQLWIMLAGFGLNMRRIETIRINPWRSNAANSVYKTLWHMCYHTCDSIILQTEDQGPYFSKRDQKKCVVIRNPLAESYIKADNRKYNEKNTRFVAVGRLDSQKNFPMLIKAFADVASNNDELTLDIYGVGSNEYTAFLQACIDDAGMSNCVTLKGQTDDVCGALMAHDCFVLSSDFEGMPNALAEAMATGMVCVSTDCKTGPCDMIDHGRNGYLVKTGDADDMAQTIKRVCAMPGQQSEQMGKAAREDILKLCDDDVNISKLIEIIEAKKT